MKRNNQSFIAKVRSIVGTLYGKGGDDEDFTRKQEAEHFAIDLCEKKDIDIFENKGEVKITKALKDYLVNKRWLKGLRATSKKDNLKVS